MNYEEAQKWPFNDSCAMHTNIEDNEHIMRGKKKKKNKYSSVICSKLINIDSSTKS